MKQCHNSIAGFCQGCLFTRSCLCVLVRQLALAVESMLHSPAAHGYACCVEIYACDAAQTIQCCPASKNDSAEITILINTAMPGVHENKAVLQLIVQMQQ